MSNVLKVKIAGQRYRYEVMQVVFEKDNEWLKDPKELIQGKQRDFLRFNDNRLDICDYEQFNYVDAGVAICYSKSEIFYELGDAKGKIQNHNVLSALNHTILNDIDDANEREGMTLVSADVYDNENTIYEYIIEVGDRDTFDETLLEIITVKDPITDEEYIVELRYDGKKLKGGVEGLPFKGEPVSKKSMLTVPQEYAAALGLGENRKLDNLLRFDDFIKEEKQKVKSMKDYVKIREDYIHSFIDEHERDHEPEEE